MKNYYSQVSMPGRGAVGTMHALALIVDTVLVRRETVEGNGLETASHLLFQ